MLIINKFDEGIASAISEEESTGDDPLGGDRKLCEEVNKAEKKEKKSVSSAEKQARKDERFSLKQEKRKEKHRGH